MANVPESEDARLSETEGDSPRVSERNIVSFAAALLAAALILAALYYGRDILIPLATAFLISFALNPPVTWLTRLGLPRLVATITIMIVLLIVLSGLGFLLAAQVRTLALELPTYQTTMLRKLSDIRKSLSAPGALSKALKTVERVQEEVTSPPPAAEPGGEPVQRVEAVPPRQTPFEQAFAWLGRALAPLATGGIILIFVFLALIDRTDLRDRFLRLTGGNVHRSTESMEEAGARVSKYLLMQIAVNVSYGVPMALGLWIIGVPGALLWGSLAALLRFVPYLGPMIGAIFPIALSFAVDDGWNMVLWTVALIVFLELVSNNIVEPLLYGASTGLSAISLIASAMFWTALWGPVGLILSTPITVCLLVFGRNFPQLQFLDTLLGSTPVLDLPTRIYQRLIASDPDEAIELASEKIETSSQRAFYNDVCIDVLRRASEDYLGNASAAHRLRFATGMDALLDELGDEEPAARTAAAEVVCIGGKWEVDAIAARILAHALGLEGVPAEARPLATVNRHYVEKLPLKGRETVCLSYFSENPAIPARHFVRRLRMRWPDLRIVLALWNAPLELLEEAALERLGADAVVNSVDEAVRRIHRIVAPDEAAEAQQAELPVHDAERVAALHMSGLLGKDHRDALDAIAKRAADVFNANMAVITTVDDDREYFVGQCGDFPASVTDESGALLPMPRGDAICNYVVGSDEALVIPDIERDPRFADNEAITRWGVRFYAGYPLRSKDGLVLGAFCILDDEPREFEEKDLELLETMAAEVGAAIADDSIQTRSTQAAAVPASATVGQQVPE